MRLSVVIPVYNKQDYLQSCFNSLEAQTFRDFEVIIVDDGSSDSSPRMCDEFAARSSLKVSVIHKENEGLMRARRDGIHAACGDYIIHHDADDDLRDICVERINECIAMTNADVVWFCFSMRPDYSDRVGIAPPAEGGCGLDLGAARMLICEGAHNAIDTKVARRDLLEGLEVYDLYSGVMIGEDLLQSVNLYSRDLTTAYIADSLVYYNQNEQSSTKNYSRKNIDDVACASAYLIDHAIRWGDGYSEAARMGVARQLCGIASMIDDSSLTRAEKTAEFGHLSAVARNLLSSGAYGLNLRLYHRAMMRALMGGHLGVCRALARFRNFMRP